MEEFDESFMAPCMNVMGYGMRHSNENLENALELIGESIKDEREDELFYDYLISIAPTEEEKDIITSIRNDERNHNKWLREVYQYYTGKEVEKVTDENFEKPDSYIDGVRRAFFNELRAMEKYRFIREGLPLRVYRDVLFRILTDEMKHAIKFNYIMMKEPETAKFRSIEDEDRVPYKNDFSREEAAAIALLLGIDFAKEKFDLNQFWMGVNVELEHGRRDLQTNVTEDNPLLTGKIALAHLREFPDYYTRLKKFEEEAKAYWSNK